MKYVRVILAVEDDRLDDLDNYLTCVIESPEIPPEFVVDDRGRPVAHDGEGPSNPIVGAHTSAPYESREDAIGIDWIETGSPALPEAEIGGLARYLLDVITEEDDLDQCHLVERLAAIVPPRFLGALCNALELCPIHHCDAAICADDGVEECAAVR